MLIEVYPGVTLDPASVDIVRVHAREVRIFRKRSEGYQPIHFDSQADAGEAAREITRKVNVTLNHQRRKSRQELSR
jgi:hypothetical protein